MITIQVSTSYDLTGWPREIVVVGDHPESGMQALRVHIDCPANPADWKRVAEAFEEAAAVIRRDCVPKE